MKFEIINGVLHHHETPKFSCRFKKNMNGSYDSYDLKVEGNVDFMKLASVLREAGDYYAEYLKKHVPPTK